MTTVVFDSSTKTLYADTQATDTVGTVYSGTNFNNLKLFRTSDFVFGGAGDYYAVTSMMAHLVGWNLDQKIREIPNLRGPENWNGQCIVATNNLVALFECILITPFLPFRKRYTRWECTNIWDYKDDTKAMDSHRYLCIGSGELAFKEGIAKTNNVIESFAHAASIDPFTGGRLISTGLQDHQLIVDHGPIGWII
jgi:hypothetical protein